MFAILMALIAITVSAFSFSKSKKKRAKLNLATMPSFNQGSTMAHIKRMCLVVN